jgi:hypothetical protein
MSEDLEVKSSAEVTSEEPGSKRYGLKQYTTIDPSKIDIGEFFEFLKTKGIPDPSLLPPPVLKLNNPSNTSLSSLSVPPIEADSTNQAVPTSAANIVTSRYGAGRELEIFNIDGIDFNEITFTPLGKDKEVKLLFPTAKKITPVLTPKTQEEFAQSYIHMLGLKEEMIKQSDDIVWRNRLSSIIFKCTMSLILGYLYNHTKSFIENAIFEKALSPADADEIGMMLIQSEIENGIMDADDYAAQVDRLEFVRERVMKEGVVSQAFKEFAGIPKPLEIPINTNQTAENLSYPNNQTAVEEQRTTESYDHYYETIFEMVCRVGAQPLDDVSEAASFSYARLLKSVCSKICTILVSYGVVSEAIMEKWNPIWDAALVLVDTSDRSNLFARLKAIIVLGVAYNSYGWLFAVVAPFAIPAIISFTGWGLGFLARMPVKIISFAGQGVWGVGKWLVTDPSSRSVYTPPPQSDGSLICVGHTRRQVGEDPNDFALVPYLVSMNDINALTYEIMNAKITKPSLASWFCDARGLADLKMQGDTGDTINIAPFFKETNPIGNLLKCIDSEIMELTDDTPNSGMIKTMPEIVFSIFFNTIIQDEHNNGSLIGPVFSFCAQSLHEAISAVRSDSIGAIKAIVNEVIMGKDATIMATPNDSDTGSNSSSNISTSSFVTAKSLEAEASEDVINRLSINVSSDISVQDLILIDLELKQDKMSRLKRIKKSTLAAASASAFALTKDNLDRANRDVHSDEHPVLLPVLDLSVPPPLSPFPSTSSIPSSTSSTSSTLILDSISVSDTFKLSINLVKEDLHQTFLKEKTKEVQALVQSTQQTIENIDRMIINAMTETKSDFIVISVGEWIVGKIADAAFGKSAGGYRRRKGPILAQIKNQINNLGFIKPKLVRNKRKSKRYGPKKGTKKWRKRYGSRRGTKKVYRKRHNTHKKRK